jgi:cytochrome c-type biogenesis protein CcmH/NrfG
VQRLRGARGRALAAALVVLLALAASWTAYQPVRALHATDEAFDRLDAGQPVAAAAIARIATKRDPLAVDPLFALAAIEQSRGRAPEAEAALVRAVRLQPADAETWRQLGRLRLSLGRPREALRAFRAAYFLDPASATSASDIVEATRAAASP